MACELILVNEKDQEIGYDEKMNVHKQGKLHRAFSVFFFNQESNSFLIQKRAAGKYHSGGLWSNTCCSHFYKGEALKDALERCIKDELCMDLELTVGNEDEAGSFYYYSDYGMLKEHEIDHVFVINIQKNKMKMIAPNPDEVEELKWIERNDLEKCLLENPEFFTSWFADAYKVVCNYLEKL